MTDNQPDAMKQYGIVTLAYWAFTLTDGALRMLVLLYFYQQGYGPMSLALLFMLYEFFGVVTNLIGGWLGARWGLNRTMILGLGLQLVALAALLLPVEWLTLIWVMGAQALSGIAKDLNKMSAKSGVKALVSHRSDDGGLLFRWVAWLTGSKNALKGLGFFLGGALLQWAGFQTAIAILMGLIAVALIGAGLGLTADIGKANTKPKFKDLWSRSTKVNQLSLARLFLFASRDVWFVVSLPVVLTSVFGWQHSEIGGYFALWIMGYGVIQGLAPWITQGKQRVIGAGDVILWSIPLIVVVALLAIQWQWGGASQSILLWGLALYAGLFAVISSLHSALILYWSRADGVSLDVGFYYMSNAAGRLLGTLLSGLSYQWLGLGASLALSALLLMLSVLSTLRLK
jgi:MFS family permease